ncbi:hypothetical protein ABVK25_009369 [Lepraria finkii]|uniref:Uncharacterized protein n=1 Tax=Lepraria finkii TaxID=1340010 RepID=A0ABR4AXK7_9LECA
MRHTHYFEANMTIVNLAVIVSVMLWPGKGSAYPHPGSSAAIQPNTGVSNIHLRSNPPISLPLTPPQFIQHPDPTTPKLHSNLLHDRRPQNHRRRLPPHPQPVPHLPRLPPSPALPRRQIS